VAAVERARELVRAAVLEQNLPGVSVAVGIGLPSVASAKEGTVVWAEGFGWRDVVTRDARHAEHTIQHRHRGVRGHRLPSRRSG
jgi:predicted NBD/HSP70 family sugar kinase